MPMTEYWYNTNYHVSTKMTPFEALYEFPNLRFLGHIPSTTKLYAVDVHLKTRE
jgi:hypothetical protein